MSKRTMRLCNKPRRLCPLKLRLRSGGSRKSIAYVSCDAASMIRTVLYFEFNSTAASRTKRWKNTGRYRVILIEPTAAQTSRRGQRTFLPALAPPGPPWRPTIAHHIEPHRGNINALRAGVLQLMQAMPQAEEGYWSPWV